MALYANGIPLGRVGLIIQIARALDDLGVAPESLMRRLSMPMWHACEPDSLFPLRELYRLAEAGSHATGSRHFGLDVMQQCPLSTVGAFGQLVCGQPTVLRALRTWVRVVRRWGTSKDWWLSEAPDDVWFCRGGGVTFDVGERVMIGYALACIVQVVRWGAGPGWRPARVRVRADDTLGLDSTEMFCEAEIAPDPSVTGVAIPRDVLALPTGAGSADLPCEDALGDAPPAEFVGALRAVVVTLLQEGDLKIERVADVAGLSARSLQRRLARSGVAYKDLVREARLEIAEDRLGRHGASVTDIGYELGYSDTAHFTRAFRAWTGVTPSAYRRQHAAGADGVVGAA